jgi:HCOMODA/2-hydroxy-3-carboxy-muconic semialdehyde decarboxylase
MASRSNALNAAIEELVLANHILYSRGVVDAYGHVAMRHPEDPAKFLLTWAVAPALAIAADVMTFDLTGAALDNPEGKELYSERFIHAAIYASRPDVMGSVHSHSVSLIPFTVTDVPLRPLYHMSSFLGAGTAMYDPQPIAGDTDLLVKTPELGAALAAVLGEKSVALMRGHGSTVVGRSVREAVFRAVYTEQNAQLQAQAMRMSDHVTYLTPGESRLMDSYMKPDVRRPWELWVREAEKP